MPGCVAVGATRVNNQRGTAQLLFGQTTGDSVLRKLRKGTMHLDAGTHFGVNAAHSAHKACIKVVGIQQFEKGPLGIGISNYNVAPDVSPEISLTPWA